MINYNDLYEVLRKEKYSETLQPLLKSFVQDFSDFIIEKKTEVGHEESLFLGSNSKAKKELENSLALFRELMRIRKRKLLNLVFVATETGIMKRDYENMFGFERETFDKLVKAFEDGDKIVNKVASGKKDKEEDKNRMIMFNQDVEQFVDMTGSAMGPFTAGELANLDVKVAEILVSGGKATFVDEE